jgi:hypothetical protein
MRTKALARWQERKHHKLLLFSMIPAIVGLRIAVTARDCRAVLKIPDMSWFKVMDWNDARLNKVFPFLSDVDERSLCFCLCGETIACRAEPSIGNLGEARLSAVGGHGRCLPMAGSLPAFTLRVRGGSRSAVNISSFSQGFLGLDG